MAFERLLELRVKVNEDNSEVLISDLEMTFNVERSTTLAENTAEFVIYNAKVDTRKKILKNGNGVTFLVGYGDEGSSIIFTGNIYEVYGNPEGPDYATTIRAVSSRGTETPFGAVPVDLSYTSGALLVSVIEQIATASNLAVFGKQAIKSLKLQGNFVYSGTVRGAFSQVIPLLEIEGFAAYIDNDEIVIYAVGQKDSEFTSALLTYSSGLISVQDITEEPKDDKTDESKKKEVPRKKIGFESLIIPNLQPNSVITFKDTKEDGVYIVYKLSFSGDNFGGDFNISGEASE